MVNYHGRMWANGFSLIKPYFGEINDMPKYITASRFIQWEQLRYALEAARRLGGACAGSCLWQFAEPWANLNCTCSVDVFNQVKPAYYGEKAAFRPLHASLFYNTIIHNDCMEIETSVFNTTTEKFSGSLTLELFDLSGKSFETKHIKCEVPADSFVHTVSKESFSNLPEGLIFIRYVLKDVCNSEIETGYVIHSTDNIPYKRLIEQKECTISTEFKNNTLYITNSGDTVASGVCVECDNDRNVFFSDGCLLLLPGETKTISITGEDFTRLFISGFGITYSEIKL